MKHRITKKNVIDKKTKKYKGGKRGYRSKHRVLNNNKTKKGGNWLTRQFKTVSIAKTLNLLFIYYCIQPIIDPKYVFPSPHVESEKTNEKLLITDENLMEQDQEERNNIKSIKQHRLSVLNWYVNTFKICSSKNKTLQPGQDPRYFMDSNTVCKYFYNIQGLAPGADEEYITYKLEYENNKKNVGHWANLYRYVKPLLFDELLPYWKKELEKNPQTVEILLRNSEIMIMIKYLLFYFNVNLINFIKQNKIQPTNSLTKSLIELIKITDFSKNNETNLSFKLICWIVFNINDYIDFVKINTPPNNPTKLLKVISYPFSSNRYKPDKICDINIKLAFPSFHDFILYNEKRFGLSKEIWGDFYKEYWYRATPFICIDNEKIFGGNYESTTEPSTTEPSTTEPSTTEPSTTEPSTTEPSTTKPEKPKIKEFVIFLNEIIEIQNSKFGYNNSMIELTDEVNADVGEKYIDSLYDKLTGTNSILLIERIVNISTILLFAYYNIIPIDTFNYYYSVDNCELFDGIFGKKEFVIYPIVSNTIKECNMNKSTVDTIKESIEAYLSNENLNSDALDRIKDNIAGQPLLHLDFQTKNAYSFKYSKIQYGENQNINIGLILEITKITNFMGNENESIPITVEFVIFWNDTIDINRINDKCELKKFVNELNTNFDTNSHLQRTSQRVLSSSSSAVKNESAAKILPTTPLSVAQQPKKKVFSTVREFDIGGTILAEKGNRITDLTLLEKGKNFLIKKRLYGQDMIDYIATFMEVLETEVGKSFKFKKLYRRYSRVLNDEYKPWIKCIQSTNFTIPENRISIDPITTFDSFSIFALGSNADPISETKSPDEVAKDILISKNAGIYALNKGTNLPHDTIGNVVSFLGGKYLSKKKYQKNNRRKTSKI